MAAWVWALGMVVFGFVVHKCTHRIHVRIVRPRKHRKEELCDYSTNKSQSKKHWISEPNESTTLHLAKTGIAAAKPVTLIDWFILAVNRFPDAEALRVESSPGEWRVWTWTQYWQEVQQAARSFLHLGLPYLGTVNIIGFNRPEWLISNLAAIVCGGKAAGIYSSNNSESCRFIANHCKASIIVVENGIQLEKFISIADDLNCLKSLVVYTDDVTESQLQLARNKKPTYTWKEFLYFGDTQTSTGENDVKSRMAIQRPHHVVSLIYTSGTTGTPKAVMQTHDAITWATSLVSEVLPGLANSHCRIVSYLPLSHIAAQIIDVFLPLYCTAHLPYPSTLWFARPDALKGSLGSTLVACRPTIFFAVPRVWEKFAEKIQSTDKKSTGLKKILVTWAKAKGISAFHAGQNDGCGQYPMLHWLAEKLVFRKVKHLLGLNHCIAMFSGAAPIKKDTVESLASFGIGPIVEMYGMSETCGAATICTPACRQIGTVGFVLPGIEIKLDHVKGRDKVGEGEILTRSRSNMAGYMYDSEKTRQVIDENGFIHTGDIGKFENGFLTIAGRIKELIITAGGENIAPVPIEQALLKSCPALSNCIMIGDRKKYNIVLVTLKCEVQSNGLPSTTLLPETSRVSQSSRTIQQAEEDPNWETYIKKGIATVNEQVISRAAQIQYYSILPIDFTVDGGEITPSLKLCRPNIMEKYKSQIAALYSS